ncbi:MAG: glycosyltransferase [Eggerthellaceae bacterium]|nr:glycosyltransferase [Eggerthellaceae bacterium]
MRVSVVIPCYYSEQTVAKVVRLTKCELVDKGFETEFILVNDGSKDGTFNQIELLCSEDKNIVGIDCAKNLGQHSAIMAGLQYATGDLVMLMDDDMQTHPSQCAKLLDAIVEHEECDVVFASWREHKEALWRRAGSAFATWSMRVMTKRPKDIYSSNYLVLRKHVRDEMVRYKGPFPYVQGLIFRATDRLLNVEVEHFERESGTSGYTFKTLVRLWATVLGFSMLPLRVASMLGAVIGFLGIIGAIGITVARLTNPAMQAGWPSLMAVLLICSGIILLSLGIIGEYVGRLLITANMGPQYVLRTVTDNRQS